MHNLEVIKRKIKCKECKHIFEHFSRSTGKIKEYCERCYNKRKERNRNRKEVDYAKK